MNKRSSTKVDIHVGKKLRRRRELLGLSQTEIAERIDLSHQQLQKYENATNRISAGRLFEFGQILDISITYFYDGISEDHTREYAEDDIETLTK
ncbi:MAG: helix-turn-helix transcriptional regulator, partial [Thaumarchaeota archaeon]|nr:helix-turn-helix transcriptional regulator [Nitrososphaerota archaeon]